LGLVDCDGGFVFVFVFGIGIGKERVFVVAAAVAAVVAAVVGEGWGSEAMVVGDGGEFVRKRFSPGLKIEMRGL
jgi:hypothetical protein